ncbi:MAG TPA: hypothetical protein VFV47_07050 [Hyphomicrobiaceae bacterium]|nr:hypothetical protein [Hyphomicrobiaceae bacterium]
MSDYRLPPLPDHPFERSQWSNRERMALESWGQQCAEAARAQLLARIAELEAANRDCVSHFEQMRDERDAYAASDRIKTANLASAEADAKRYRWLRDNGESDGWFDAYDVRGGAFLPSVIDQAIDKAMKESGDA